MTDVLELRLALRATQGELSRLRASCYALDALLSELDCPSEDEREERFGYEAARRVSKMRADLVREIEKQEAQLNEDSRCWVELGNVIRDEPEYRREVATGIVRVHQVAIAVIERLRLERLRLERGQP